MSDNYVPSPRPPLVGAGTTWNIVPGTAEPLSPCICGHSIEVHETRPIKGVAAWACEAKGCGCEEFTDADPDDDWMPGDVDD